MAMTKCRDCGNQISTAAAACPKCGAPVPRRSNLGIIVLGFVAIVVIASTARSCDESAKREAAQKTAQEAAQKAALLMQQQTDSFNQHHDQVLADARAALDKGDLDAAQKIIAPLNRVNDLDLEQLRKTIGDAQKAAVAAAEKAKLLDQAKVLKRDDAINGGLIYQRLVQLEPGNKEYAAKLAAFTKINERDAAKLLAESMRTQRKQLARETEVNFLKRGFSATVTTEGKDGTVLRLKFVLVSKAFAYQVQHQEDFIAACRKVGFKRIILDDGYNEAWRFDL